MVLGWPNIVIACFTLTGGDDDLRPVKQALGTRIAIGSGDAFRGSVGSNMQLSNANESNTSKFLKDRPSAKGKACVPLDHHAARRTMMPPSRSTRICSSRPSERRDPIQRRTAGKNTN